MVREGTVRQEKAWQDKTREGMVREGERAWQNKRVQREKAQRNKRAWQEKAQRNERAQ